MKKFLFGFAFGLSFISAMLEVADGGYDRDVVRYALIAVASLLGLVFA
jgi:hypothetical protein